ncbi:hypothetical protein AURDEDRAFT_126740 [Auricularia subglabra TFB-10046 SS5]|nr:hypothetical protein AURDEDRAFT_126740 [Auricularia subglabra TFB-10046 SS5]
MPEPADTVLRFLLRPGRMRRVNQAYVIATRGGVGGGREGGRVTGSALARASDRDAASRSQCTQKRQIDQASAPSVTGWQQTGAHIPGTQIARLNACVAATDPEYTSSQRRSVQFGDRNATTLSGEIDDYVLTLQLNGPSSAATPKAADRPIQQQNWTGGGRLRTSAAQIPTRQLPRRAPRTCTDTPNMPASLDAYKILAVSVAVALAAPLLRTRLAARAEGREGDWPELVDEEDAVEVMCALGDQEESAPALQAAFSMPQAGTAAKPSLTAAASTQEGPGLDVAAPKVRIQAHDALTLAQLPQPPHAQSQDEHGSRAQSPPTDRGLTLTLPKDDSPYGLSTKERINRYLHVCGDERKTRDRDPSTG